MQDISTELLEIMEKYDCDVATALLILINSENV